MTWFLARLGEIIEDFPLTVPVEVDEAHQCVSRLSRHEEMQIWSRGHVPLGVWFSVIHSFFAGLWDMWSPSRSWTFLLDSEDCLSELKSNYSNENRDRPNWSCVRSGDDSNLHVWSLWLHRKQTKVCVAMWSSDYHGFSAVVLFRWARNGHARLDPQFGGYFVLRKVPHVFPCFKEKDMIY